MELELVEHADRERKLRRRSAVDQHVLLAGSRSRLGHRHFEVGHVGDQRPLADIDAGLLPAVDKDRYAVVVVATPAGRRLEGSPAGDHRPGRHQLAIYLAVDAPYRDFLEVAAGVRQEPTVQTVAGVA